ncbi:MFS general substrate transporter [Gloeophyllum trabeum ATCC 11539]|uniref:MFS general substrate transporter n=1 Tax=Gloeophyllum trabeum (strain ATCC 11539 / FP-39264 / Madison 617) TaxID=670483 RepID=S7RGD6_GLOTA|nr:MFS general substrate transporter [Gloeophyllum trabeum ATCC 11539]EPQ53290.1 MFS general substrate transporter [Gloeophyllum trabeum ATCC 11539]
MGLGILEDKHLENVPGTSIFSDDPNAAAQAAYEGVDLSLLKHGKGRNAHVMLVPQPTDDPNDPLNWPQWKKHMVFFVLVYGTVICGALGPLVSADVVNLAVEFHTSIQAISRALGSSLAAALAIATVVWSTLAVKIGKRPVFLASALIMMAGAIMSAYAHTCGVLLGSRIVQGVGQSVLEFLVGASINDIYFTHERGIPVALWNLALLDGINITPPISGAVIQHLGWRWAFKIFAVAVGLLFLLQFFCMPETTYYRSQVINVHLPVNHNQSVQEAKADSEATVDIEKQEPSVRLESAEPESDAPRKKSYIQELAVFSGVYPTRVSFLALVWRPIESLATPIVLWAGLVYGVAITWLVLLATSVSQLFSAPPYNFDTSQVGLTYMGPFIGAMLAALISGPLADWLARHMSAWNKGTFEPEFRLPLVAFYSLFGSMAFFGWGISAHTEDPWIGPVFFFGLANFGITLGASGAIAYVVDAHRRSAESAMGGVIFFKNVFSLVITLFINDWIAARGVLSAFCTVGGVTLFTTLLTIPMYAYGKRARSWIHRCVKLDADD